MTDFSAFSLLLSVKKIKKKKKKQQQQQQQITQNVRGFHKLDENDRPGERSAE